MAARVCLGRGQRAVAGLGTVTRASHSSVPRAQYDAVIIGGGRTCSCATARATCISMQTGAPRFIVRDCVIVSIRSCDFVRFFCNCMTLMAFRYFWTIMFSAQTDLGFYHVHAWDSIMKSRTWGVNDELWTGLHLLRGSIFTHTHTHTHTHTPLHVNTHRVIWRDLTDSIVPRLISVLTRINSLLMITLVIRVLVIILVISVLMRMVIILVISVLMIDGANQSCCLSHL